MRKTSNRSSNSSTPPNNRFNRFANSNNNNSNIDRQAERFRNKFEEPVSRKFKRNKQEQDEQEEESYQDFQRGQDMYSPKAGDKGQDMYTAKDKPEDYYTGEKNRKLLVHIMESGIEVTKPIRKRIYDQQVIWKKRIYPIDIKQTIVDAKGIHHLYVSANDMAVLSFRKDHADHCRKCNGKMFIDARNARDLLKRNTIQAIWGIDSTHMILLMVFAVGMMAAVGFAFYSFNQDTRHTAELTAEKAKTVQLTIDNSGLINQTRTLQGLLIDRPPTSNPNEPVPPRTTTPRTSSEPIR